MVSSTVVLSWNAMSHINDAGYWIFTKLSGLNVADGLRTWTVLTTLLGTLGFVADRYGDK
ncbi:Inner membrane permease YgbN [compost metagenome]